MKQVREKKRWPCQSLGEAFAKAFREMMDYARTLEFGSKLDYGSNQWRKKLRSLTFHQRQRLLPIYI